MTKKVHTKGYYHKIVGIFYTKRAYFLNYVLFFK